MACFNWEDAPYLWYLIIAMVMNKILAFFWGNQPMLSENF